MKQRVRALRDRHMAGRRNAWEEYDAVVAEHLAGEMTVLDVGCGKGLAGPFPWHQYPSVTVIGLDPDPAAAQNPQLQRFVLMPADGSWPLPDQSVDLVICRSVLEHVAEPHQFLANLKRVLRPGGGFVFLAANKAHPTMVLAQLMPFGLKRRLLRAMGRRIESDVFPACYRMSTPGTLARLAQAHGFEVRRLEGLELEPIGYLDFSVPTYWLSYLMWRVLQGTGLQRLIGARILGVWRKAEGLVPA